MIGWRVRTSPLLVLIQPCLVCTTVCYDKVSWSGVSQLPNWAAHVTYMGVVALYIRKAWIRDLMVSYDRLSMMLIHMAAKLVTRTFEEPTVVGGAAATFSVGGSVVTIRTYRPIFIYLLGVLILES